MKTYYKKAVYCISLLIAVYASSASAQWQLNGANSTLNLVASKKIHTSEVFVIKDLTGGISDSGALSIKLNLSSIDSGIGIRDERMQAHLFEVEKYPLATISSQLDQSVMDQLKQVGFLQTTANAMIDLHGTKLEVKVDLNVMSTGSKLLISARKPLLINSEMFGLSKGIAKLGELAGGISISQTVAVNFSLLMEQ